jgi:hypothetical protein
MKAQRTSQQSPLQNESEIENSEFNSVCTRMTLIYYQTLWRTDCHPQNAQCAISNTILLDLSIEFLLVAFHLYATLDLGCSTSQLESCVARSDGFV